MAKNSAIGPRTSAGKKVSAPTINIVANQKMPNVAVSVRSVAVVTGSDRLTGDRARDRHHEDDRRVAADQDDESSRPIIPGRVGIESSKGRTVVGGRRAKGIENFGISVWTGVRHRCEPVGRDDRPTSRRENDERMDQQDKRNQDDLGLFDLLAEELGCSADHQTSDENRDDSIGKRRQKANALAAKDALQHHPDEQRQGAERREAIMHRVHASRGECGRDGCKQSALSDAEADFLAFHVAARLIERRRRFDARIHQDRVPACSEAIVTGRKTSSNAPMTP